MLKCCDTVDNWTGCECMNVGSYTSDEVLKCLERMNAVITRKNTSRDDLHTFEYLRRLMSFMLEHREELDNPMDGTVTMIRTYPEPDLIDYNKDKVLSGGIFPYTRPDLLDDGMDL